MCQGICLNPSFENHWADHSWISDNLWWWQKSEWGNHPALFPPQSQTWDSDRISYVHYKPPRHWADSVGRGEHKEPRRHWLLYWGLRLQPHDKFVAFRVNEFLPEPQERELHHGDHQGEVQMTQWENLTLTEDWGHWLLAHQGPLAPSPVLMLVLHSGARGEITRKESLTGRMQGVRNACTDLRPFVTVS